MLRWVTGFAMALLLAMVGLMVWTRAREEPLPSDEVTARAEPSAPEATVAPARGEPVLREPPPPPVLEGESEEAEDSEGADFEADPTWQPSPEEGVTPSQAAQRIASSGPALVMFFSTDCPLSRRAAPQFARLAQAYGDRVQILAFETRSRQSEIDDFVAAAGGTFSAEGLGAWQAGEFSRAMGEIGLSVGSRWMQPLVAVVARDGSIAGQWQGITDLRPVEAVLRQVLG